MSTLDIINIIVTHFRVFYTSVSRWFPIERKFPQVSRTLLSILADLSNTVVWIVSSCPLIPKSFSSYINPLVTVSRAPITIGISVTFMFHCFINSLVSPGTYPSFSFRSILLRGQPRQQSPQFGKFSFFSFLFFFFFFFCC